MRCPPEQWDPIVCGRVADVKGGAILESSRILRFVVAKALRAAGAIRPCETAAGHTVAFAASSLLRPVVEAPLTGWTPPPAAACCRDVVR
jgi:hypothetical protein